MSPSVKADIAIISKLPTSLDGKAILSIPTKKDPHKALDGNVNLLYSLCICHDHLSDSCLLS